MMKSDSSKEMNPQPEEWQKNKMELQARIDELSDKLYEVNKKLKETEAYKGHFISNITNEIVNPFASIIALSENILSLGDTNMAKARRMAGLINTEASHLDFQLSNIFVAATVESGKEFLNYTSFNIKDLVSSVTDYFNKQVEEKGIFINTVFEDKSSGNNAESFVSDYKKVEMILKNLLSNAVKFSHVGDKVEMLIKVSEEELEFSIRDYGKGVPEEHRKQIYDRFKQVDERINSINSGHGLGLSIVKSYCSLLEGTLAMQFPTDGGTKVIVELPMASMTDQDDDWSDFMIDMGEKF